MRPEKLVQAGVLYKGQPCSSQDAATLAARENNCGPNEGGWNIEMSTGKRTQKEM